MTESAWQAAKDARILLNYLRNFGQLPGREGWGRKYRLFACACVRRAWDRSEGDAERAAINEADRVAIDVAERLADRRATAEELVLARRMAHGMARKSLLRSGRMAANDVCTPFGYRPDLAELLRDIFGNPYASVTFAPRWLTADVVGLARGIYEDRAFDRMPILADALLDAGVEDERVLAHCRSATPHVKGCWLIDGLLSKS
jgi:hypothetical protein